MAGSYNYLVQGEMGLGLCNPVGRVIRRSVRGFITERRCVIGNGQIFGQGGLEQISRP